MRKRLLTLVGIICMISEILEYLALPALFAVIGLWNGFGWQYYAWTVGGYVVLLAIAELAGAMIGTMMGRAFEPRLLRKLRGNQPTEEN